MTTSPKDRSRSRPIPFPAFKGTSLRSIVSLAIVLAVFGSRRASADLVLTANDPGSQQSTIAGVTTQTFNSIDLGRYKSLDVGFGTLASDNLQIVRADSYGGAGGSGRYFSVGTQSGGVTATLTLNTPQAYFGMWWSAADAQNKLSFLSGGKTVATFDSAAALGSLSSAYLGNPNGSGNGGEKYAYLNFYGTNGTTFDQIIFSNANMSTGFESDNWSVTTKEVPNPLPGTIINGVVPEPTSLVLMGVGFFSLVGYVRYRQVVPVG